MDIKKTDPEFAERFERFAYYEVVNEDGRTLEAPVRYLAILAALIGCEPQLTSHARGNMNLGNDKAFLSASFRSAAVHRLPALSERDCLREQSGGYVRFRVDV